MSSVFHDADILAHKGQPFEAALQPGGDLGRIAPRGFFNVQIGGDDHGPSGQQPVVHQIVQRRCDKIAGQLRAQIVNDQKITFCQLGNLLTTLLVGIKAVLLQLGEQMVGAFVRYRITTVRHHPGNAGRQKRLAQAGTAHKQQISASGAETCGIFTANAQIAFHDSAGACAVLGIVSVGVILQPEILKPLVAGGQQRKLLLLFLPAQFLQALAHGAAHIAGTAAKMADGTVIQETFFKILLRQLPPLFLQCQICLLHLFHG